MYREDLKSSGWAIVSSILILITLFVAFPGTDHYKMAPDISEKIDQAGMQFFRQLESAVEQGNAFPEMILEDGNDLTEERIALGRLLFFDPVLSGDNTVSCATCHHPDLGFSDDRPRSMGVGGAGLGRNRAGGADLPRNTPTIWNAAYNQSQFWDGRARTLEEQAAGPILHPLEMDQDPGAVVEELKEIPEYRMRFASAYGEAGDSTVTFQKITYAIAAFERTLITNASRFDAYASGKRNMLSDSERRGLNLFRSLKTRCFECHNTPTFANADFKVIGVPETNPEQPDMGRGAIQGEAYTGAFKVPTLRNIALTAPYMHNGVFETLSEVIDFYAAGGGRIPGEGNAFLDDKIRPFTLTEQEKDDLIAFLHALTDESSKPWIPRRVPSGYPVVPRIEKEAAALETISPVSTQEENPSIRKQGNMILVRDGERIQPAIDAALAGDTILVFPGTYHEALTIDMSGITLKGIQVNGRNPVLDGKGVLNDGIVGTGSDVNVSGMVIQNYIANGIMMNRGRGLTFSELELHNTGLYGVYPVEVMDVLIENTTVTGARDAGIYVGQAKNAVVRQNKVYKNVTGIEIENTLNAVVENNEVYDNAGGILVFLLPNNPSKLSRNTIVKGNNVYRNNHRNFADPAAIVSRVPSGTGIMILASDEVEVFRNTIRNNNSVGIAVLGLDSVLDQDGGYDVDPYPDKVVIYANFIDGNGLMADQQVIEAGFDGADLLWDLTGSNNSWDQSESSRLPYRLPDSSWSRWRRGLNVRFWQAISYLL